MLGVRRADDDDAPAHAEDVDLRAVEAGQRLGRQHLVDRADRPAAGAEVEDAIDRRRIGLTSCVTKTTGVPALRRRSSSRWTTPAGRRGRARAAARRRAAASGRTTSACATRSRCCSPPESRPSGASASAVAPTAASAASTRAPVGRREPAEAPAVAVEAEAHEVAPAQRQVAVEHALLRDVADAVAVGRDAPVDVGSSSPSRMRSSDVLPVPFGPSTARNSPALELEAEAVAQSSRSPKRERQTLDRDDARSSRRAPASARAWSSCQPGTSGAAAASRVTARPECPALCAAARTRVVIGETACAVVEQHLDPMLRSERVHRSDGGGRRLVPSSIGRVNDAGARLRNPLLEQVARDRLGVRDRRAGEAARGSCAPRAERRKAGDRRRPAPRGTRRVLAVCSCRACSIAAAMLWQRGHVVPEVRVRVSPVDPEDVGDRHDARGCRSARRTRAAT